MKIWLKYLICCGLGIVASFIMPSQNPLVLKIVHFLSEFAIRTGRYALLPLLFFSMTVAAFKLRETGKLFTTAISTTIIAILTSFVLTLIGGVSILLIKTPRLPISVAEISQTVTLSIPENLLAIFPYSSFSAVLDGAYLLPLFALAGFIGAGCASDPIASKPVLTFFDSFSKVCYSILSFFIDIVALGFITITIGWMFQYLDVIKSGAFNFLFILLTVDMLFIIFILYPVLLKVFLKEKHPYRILYASAASLMTAFFTADTNLTLAVNLRHAKESLGIRRRIGTLSLPVFSTFARGGAALVTTVSLIVILKSYSSLGFYFSDILWIFGFSLLLSFFLGALPTGGPFVALTMLCTMYGRGFESGYLILKPVAFFICSVAATIDAATAMFGTYYIASKQKMVENKDVYFYI